MSVQYTDRSFSDNMPFDDAVREFVRAAVEGDAHALYVGTEAKLDAIKKKASLEDEIKSLQARMEKLEEGPVHSDSVVIPTRDEMIQALRGKKS